MWPFDSINFNTDVRTRDPFENIVLVIGAVIFFCGFISWPLFGVGLFLIFCSIVIKRGW